MAEGIPWPRRGFLRVTEGVPALHVEIHVTEHESKDMQDARKLKLPLFASAWVSGRRQYLDKIPVEAEPKKHNKIQGKPISFPLTL